MEDKLISVSEAEKLILQETFKLNVETIGLDKCTGRILLEDIIADRDFPPFDRVMMDGIAIRYSSFEDGVREYRITGFQAAGTIQQRLIEDKDCIEVMTGSMMPMEADTVIPYEKIKIKGNTVFVDDVVLFKGQHVHMQGSDHKREGLLISKGVKLSPAEVGILATVGKAKIDVAAYPKIAIISTGDELVDVEDIPAPHQIRKSNSITIMSALHQYGFTGEIFHLPDQKEEVRDILEELLHRFDVLLISGGVSKGKKDYLPDVLNDLQVKKIFHGVAQRPGKPFWFGRHNNSVIFSFPGNPVSAFLCLYRYFFPWLYKSFGFSNTKETAILTDDFNFKPPLIYFLQVKIKMDKEGKVLAIPSKGNGSGDLANLSEADGFLELPADKEAFIKGNAYPLFRYRF